MRPNYGWPLLLTAIVFGTARCTGSGQDRGPSNDIPASSSAAAQDCAAKLPPAASIIYKDAAPDVHADTNMENLLRGKVMTLIVTNRIQRSEARPAAERAVECLEMLQR